MMSWEKPKAIDNETSKEMDALKKFVVGDNVKIVILEQLTKENWCTLNELWRAAKRCDRYVGHVRIATILQYMESIAKSILEKEENGSYVKWRIKPDKKKVIESWVKEVKSSPHYKNF